MRYIVFFIFIISPTVLLAESVIELEDVLVTGSSIQSSDADKLLPISVYTAKDIQKTGVRTINDYLKYIPEVDFFDNGNQTSGGDYNGVSTIRLRGLGEHNTLVLLNGRRLAPNSVQDDNGVQAAVNINQIPLAAIERIEILKTGASAVYGSDAVAGVVNFITKSNVQNGNAFGNFGISSHGDADEKNAGFILGFGDPQKDKHNTFMSFEYFKREPVFRSDRSLTKSVDFRPYGGQDRRSGSAPQGNILDAKGNPTGQSYRPCPPDDFNGVCRYDYNTRPWTSLNGTERFNFFGQNLLQLNATTTLDTDFIYSKILSTGLSHPIPDVFTLPNGQLINGRFMQGGNRNQQSEADFYQISSSLKGMTWGQFWEINAGYGNSSNDRFNSNYFLRSNLNRLISGGLIDPTVTTNNQALVDQNKVAFSSRSQTELIFAGLKFDGDLLKIKDNVLSYAAGMQWRRESLKDITDDIAQSGQVAGYGALSSINAHRNVYSGFSELNLKLFKQLEIQAAVRYDGYDNAQNISPSFALAYSPHSKISLHANWGQSFLMPTLRQSYAQGTQTFVRVQGAECQYVNDPERRAACDRNGLDGFITSASNASLGPERATNWTAGFDFKPTSFMQGAFNYWQIEKTNEVFRPTYLVRLQNGYYSFKTDDPRIYFDSSNINLASSQYQGIDAELDFNWDLKRWGQLTWHNNLLYYLSIKRKQAPTLETETLLDYASGIAPWKTVSSFTWTKNSWSASVIVRTTAGFRDSQVYPTASNPAPASLREVSSYTEADVMFGYTGFKHLNLTGGVKNFTNAMPPYSMAAQINSPGLAHAMMYDTRGAYFFLTANYTFDYVTCMK